MSALPVVVSNPIEVADELSRLGGLSPDDLREALLGGLLGRGTCTENDPPYFPGSMFHGVTTRSTREQLLPKQWTKDDSGGYSRTISPDGTIAIVVATGDEWTGRNDVNNPERQPKTTQGKGPLTHAVIQENERQYEMVGVLPIREETPTPRTWVFLIHYAGEGSATAELSLPRELDSESRICAWRRRIIIVSGDDTGPEPVRRGVPEPGPDFDVDITPRVG